MKFSGFSLDRLTAGWRVRRARGSRRDPCLGPAPDMCRPGGTLAIHPYGRSAVHPPARPARGGSSGRVMSAPSERRSDDERACSEGPSRTAPRDVIELATKIFDLARQGETETLAAYVDAGVPANLTNDRGDTLVMLAAYHGHADAVAALLARGAEADRANDRGQTPLAGAVFKGEEAVIRALLAGGADPNAGTPSAVDTARMFGKTDLLELFGAE